MIGGGVKSIELETGIGDQMLNCISEESKLNDCIEEIVIKVNVTNKKLKIYKGIETLQQCLSNVSYYCVLIF